MATKTLSVDEDAYRILSKARKFPTESFSKVIKRASWEDRPRTGREFLSRMAETKEVMSDEALDYLETIQNTKKPSVSKWDL